MDALDLAREMPHPCEAPGCDNKVPYDDEPFCLKHSDDEGSYARGYSFRRKHAEGN
jgi:hypothetical protein